MSTTKKRLSHLIAALVVVVGLIAGFMLSGFLEDITEEGVYILWGCIVAGTVLAIVGGLLYAVGGWRAVWQAFSSW